MKWFQSCALYGALFSFCAWVYFCRLCEKPLSISVAQTYTILPNQPLKQWLDDMNRLHPMPFPWFWHLLVWTSGHHIFKPGIYTLDSKTTPISWVKLLEKGIYYRISFPEGSTFEQIKERMARHPCLKHTSIFQSKQIMADLGCSSPHREGYFFPDTYFFTFGTQDKDILKLSCKKMMQVLEKEWKLRNTSVPYVSAHEALIAASLIEKETPVHNEKSLISGVIVKRLNRGMRLQIDASVVYGLQNHQGPLLYSELKIPTPYNTYKRPGLPPTPICMPGLASIRAALRPEKEFLYFVAKPNPKEGHNFSDNLADHHQACRLYYKAIRG